MAIKTEREHRKDILEIGRLVYQKAWVAANDGNISLRMDDGRLLTTPTGISKGMMTEDDLVVVDMQGNKLAGSKRETSELAMHLTVYSIRPDVRAVLHAHPPVATGFAAAGRPLNLALLPEIVIGLGSVPLADYGLPGTDELTRPMLPYIPQYDAVLMGNHGVTCWGEDVYKAFYRMEMVEHFARITLVAELLGGPRVLPRVEVDKLLNARARYGVSTKAGGVPGLPLVAEDVEACPEKAPVTRGEVAALVEEVLKARGI